MRDFVLVFLKMLLCLYKTPVTPTDTTRWVFTLSLFQNFEASSNWIIIFDLASHNNFKSSSSMRLEKSYTWSTSSETWKTEPLENLETKVFTWTSLGIRCWLQRDDLIFNRITWKNILSIFVDLNYLQEIITSLDIVGYQV